MPRPLKKKDPEHIQLGFGPHMGQTREQWLEIGLAMQIHNFEQLQAQFEEVKRAYLAIKNDRDRVIASMFK